jgi:starvation-inducible DNA-binding protein
MLHLQMPIDSCDEQIADLAAGLQQTLVELLDLSLVARQLHWTVVGPAFGSLHAQLDALAEVCSELADRVAERSVTLGLPPDGQPHAVATQSRFEPLPAELIVDQRAFTLLVDRLAETVMRLRVRLSHMTLDPVSEDVLRDVLAELEKQR